jgi:hypothetical protein
MLALGFNMLDGLGFVQVLYTYHVVVNIYISLICLDFPDMWMKIACEMKFVATTKESFLMYHAKMLWCHQDIRYRTVVSASLVKSLFTPSHHNERFLFRHRCSRT